MSEIIRRRLESRWRDDESYNDTLERILDAEDTGDFSDEFSILSDEERWVMPAPAYAETIAGVGNHPAGDVDRAIEALSWGEDYNIDGDPSVGTARMVNEIGSQGPYPDSVDSLVAAAERKLGTPVVSANSDLIYAETRMVVDVEEY